MSTKNGQKIMSRERIIKLTTTALMLALALILSFIKVYEMPQGGSITAVSMMPIILIAYLYGTKWGIFTGFAYSLLQLITDFSSLRGLSIGTFVAAIFLDYIIAFSVLGLAGMFKDKFKNKALEITLGTIIAVTLRFFAHFLSGFLLWSAYAEDMNPILYSLVYNGSYMLPELIITTIFSSIIILILMPILKKYRT